MNKKWISLMFVVVIAGCHSQSEGAICPAPEDYTFGTEPLPDPSKVERTPELEAEMEKARRRTRENRRHSSW